MQRALRTLGVVLGAVYAVQLAAYFVSFGISLLPSFYLWAVTAYALVAIAVVVAMLLALAKVLDYLDAITTRLERLESESGVDQP